MVSSATLLALPGFWAARISDADGVTVELYGELDLASSAELERELMAALLRVEHGHLKVCLEAVDFMDCTGLHVLIEAQRRCDQAGVGLVLRPGPRVVQRLFELTGTERLFRFAD